VLEVADQQASMVLAQAEVDGKTNEITCLAPLLAPLDLAGAVVTADAMHAQREHAQFLVTEKNAHYILAVKNNQPGLYAQLASLPWHQVPAGFDARETPGRKAMAAPNGAPSRSPPSPPGSPSRTPPRPSRSSAAASR
jgi:predicted transposase YbfD/YdcC